MLDLPRDEIICVLRHYEWNSQIVQDNWFHDAESLRIKFGLDFDTTLEKKYADINASLAINNENMCQIFFETFDPSDEDMAPLALSCGHQFSIAAWKGYLKSKVREGQGCVFTTCQQTHCNVIVPHSVFVELLNNEADYDYATKY